MSDVRTLDVSALPPGRSARRTLTFWGTLGSSSSRAPSSRWPSARTFYLARARPRGRRDGVAAPDLRWGTLNTLVLLAA